jgi:hypothetical protein
MPPRKASPKTPTVQPVKGNVDVEKETDLAQHQLPAKQLDSSRKRRLTTTKNSSPKV